MKARNRLERLLQLIKQHWTWRNTGSAWFSCATTTNMWLHTLLPAKQKNGGSRMTSFLPAFCISIKFTNKRKGITPTQLVFNFFYSHICLLFSFRFHFLLHLLLYRWLTVLLLRKSFTLVVVVCYEQYNYWLKFCCCCQRG